MTVRAAASQPAKWHPPTNPGPRRVIAGVAAVGLLPPCLVLWILWFAPIGDLAADRAALAARDFSDLWAAGRLAGQNAFDVLYDSARLTAFLRDTFGSGMPGQIWPYPPPTLLLAVLVAQAPLFWGFILYTAAGLTALGCAIRRGIASWSVCGLVLFSPAMAENALAGQNGALIAAALVGGLLCIETRPRLAGMLLGLLIFKPQLGLVVPVCLIAGRHWQAVLPALLTAAAIGLASLLVFGPDVWVDYVLHARPQIASYLEAPWTGTDSQRMFVSIFMAMRALGADLALAYAVQTVTALMAAGLVWKTWRRQAGSPGSRVALTLIAAVVASPWVHGYDMPAVAVAIALLLPAARPWQRLPLGLTWMWPGTLSLFPLPAILPSVSLLLMLMVASQLSLAIGAQGGKKRLQCA